MEVSIFILFPTENEVLDQVALANPDTVREAIHNVKTYLRERNITFSFCLDSNQFQSYLDAIGITASNRKIINSVSAIKTILSKNSVNVNQHNLAIPSHVYAEWKISALDTPFCPISTLLQNLCYYENPGVFSFNHEEAHRQKSVAYSRRCCQE